MTIRLSAATTANLPPRPDPWFLPSPAGETSGLARLSKGQVVVRSGIGKSSIASPLTF